MANEGIFWMFYFLSQFYQKNSTDGKISRKQFQESVEISMERFSKIDQLASQTFYEPNELIYDSNYEKIRSNSNCDQNRSSSYTLANNLANNLANSVDNTIANSLANNIAYTLALDRMIGDFQFSCGVLEFAEKLKNFTNLQVFLYYDDYVIEKNSWPKWSGAMHGYEVSFFGFEK